MRKFVTFVFVLVLLAANPSQAQAGINIGFPGYIPVSLDELIYAIQGNNLMALTARNIHTVNQLGDQLERTHIRRAVRRGNQWGFQDEGGEFYYVDDDQNGRPKNVGRRISWKRAGGLGFLCAGLTAAFTRDWRYAAGAGAACAGGSMAVDAVRNRGNNDRQGQPVQRGTSAAAASVQPQVPMYQSAGRPVTCIGDCEKIENTSADRLYVTIEDHNGQPFQDPTTGIVWHGVVVRGGETIRVPYIKRGWKLNGEFDVQYVDDEHTWGSREGCRQILNRIQGFGWRTASRCAAGQ